MKQKINITGLSVIRGCNLRVFPNNCMPSIKAKAYPTESLCSNSMQENSGLRNTLCTGPHYKYQYKNNNQLNPTKSNHDMIKRIT